MQTAITSDCIIYDWLTFTSPTLDSADMVALLGLQDLEWQALTGRYGYQTRLSFGGVSVLYDGMDGMGVCVEMSGQGCRSFEEFTTLSGGWADLIPIIRDNDFHVTRLDVAFDDHTGLLDMDQIFQDSVDRKFVSRSRCYEPHLSGRTDSDIVGKSVTFGSRQSNTLIRIYDKAAERGIADQHWVRCEIQLRAENCAAFLGLCDTMPLGEAYAGVLLNYLRFVVPCEDTNRSRWQMASYWAEFLEGASKISLWTAPGTEYNMEKCTHYVVEIAGNAIAAMIQIVGKEIFFSAIENRRARPNPKYELLVREETAKLARVREKAKLAFELDQSDDPVWGGLDDDDDRIVSVSVPMAAALSPVG